MNLQIRKQINLKNCESVEFSFIVIVLIAKLNDPLESSYKIVLKTRFLSVIDKENNSEVLMESVSLSELFSVK